MQESTVRHWDAYWAKSNLLHNKKILDKLRNFASPLPGKAVLEIGAGSGATAIRLAQQGGTVSCLDYSVNSVKLIKENAEKCSASLNIIPGNAYTIPVQNDSFDICYHQGFLEHFRDPGRLLEEQWRILRNGGLLIIDVPQTYNFYKRR